MESIFVTSFVDKLIQHTLPEIASVEADQTVHMGMLFRGLSMRKYWPVSPFDKTLFGIITVTLFTIISTYSSWREKNREARSTTLQPISLSYNDVEARCRGASLYLEQVFRNASTDLDHALVVLTCEAMYKALIDDHLKVMRYEK